VLNPAGLFVGRSRCRSPDRGSDQHLDRTAALQWKLLGLIPVVRSSGPDLTRGAAAPAGGDTPWIPTAMLLRYGTVWQSDGDTLVTARFPVADTPVETHYYLDTEGWVRRGVFDRRGDPDPSGHWGRHPCGRETRPIAPLPGSPSRAPSSREG
jgi:hypothetical protein